MHFVAMLANEFSVPVGYDVIYTLGSGLVSILVVGVALLLLHYTVRSSLLLNVAGLILGAGIVLMHFIGMSAIRGVVPSYSIGWGVLTLLAAAATGICAIRIAYGKRSKEHIIAGGLTLGMSVVIVHYTAMHGTLYTAPTDTDVSGSDVGTIAIANPTLAIVLVVAVFILCGAFLLVATTFLTTPSTRAASNLTSISPLGSTRDSGNAVQSQSAMRRQSEPENPSAAESSAAAVSPGASQNQHAVKSKLMSDEPHTDDQSVFSGAYEVDDLSALVGSSDFVDQNNLSDTKSAVDASEKVTATQVVNSTVRSGSIRIPYERNKKILFVDSDEVATIRADGRYTLLYTRTGVCFCPWSITEAEKRLADTHFYRSHRSYLVNVQLLTSFEKRKDSGVCLFDGYEQISSVPVSRTRVTGLMELLGLA